MVEKPERSTAPISVDNRKALAERTKDEADEESEGATGFLAGMREYLRTNRPARTEAATRLETEG